MTDEGPPPLSPKVREGRRFPPLETDGGTAMLYYAYGSQLLKELDDLSSLWDDSLLGSSPAELLYCVEEERELSFAEHDGCPELRLWEDGFSQL